MWPFSSPAPGAELYPGPIKNNYKSPETTESGATEAEINEQKLNTEEQEKMDELKLKFTKINLPESQQELNADDQTKVQQGNHDLTFSSSNILNGMPSVYLAYAYYEVEQLFPEKNDYWKRQQAGKLTTFLKNKNYKN